MRIPGGILDSYSHLDGPLHRLPAGLKLAAALAIVIVTVSMPASPALFGAVGVLLVLVAAASRIPPGFLLKRLLLLEPFVLGVAVLSLLRPHGLIAFSTVVTRSTLCLLALVLLSNTTSLSDLLRVLRQVRVPALIVTTLALMHRYLYVLGEEAERMRAARASRTFSRARPQAWASLAGIIAQLFVRSGSRAERIYGAMCARGWK